LLVLPCEAIPVSLCTASSGMQ